MTANTVGSVYQCEMSADLWHEKSFLAVFGRSSWSSVAAYRTNYESNYSTEYIGIRMLSSGWSCCVIFMLFFFLFFQICLCWSFLLDFFYLAAVSPRLHMKKAVVVPALRFIAAVVAAAVVLAVGCIAVAVLAVASFAATTCFVFSLASIFAHAIVSVATFCFAFIAAVHAAVHKIFLLLLVKL